MTATISFDDPRLRDDLATFLGRAGRIEDGAVRLQHISGGGTRPDAVACWVPVLRPAGILDRSPLVIGVRALPATVLGADPVDVVDGAFDVVVPLRGLLDRLARTPADDLAALSLPVPPERLLEAWTGRRPPRAGWERVATLDAAALIRVADEGMADIAQVVSATGGMLGQVRAERVRTETWTRELPDAVRVDGNDRADDLPPAGAAFAAHALGFLDIKSPVTVAVADGWWRLATPRGQVLVQRYSAPTPDGN